MLGLGIGLSNLGIRGGVFDAADGGFSDADVLALSPFAWFDGKAATTLWQDTGATTPATNGNPVALWQDRSGNGRHASTGTSSRRPLVSASGMTFDGVDDVLRTSAVTLGDAGCSVYVVASLSSASNFATAFSYGENLPGALNVRAVATTGRPSFISGNLNTGAGASAFSTPAGTTTNMAGAGLQTLSMTLSASDVFTLWQNKTQRDQRTVAFTMATAQVLDIGNRNLAGFWPGNIAEVLLFNVEHDTATRQNIENYLSAKWGTP